jgi:preprotein translocase subunit SecE
MAKSVATRVEAGGFGGRVKGWPERIRTFYSDVRTEMKKVTAPGLKEVQATTAVVIITVALFAVYFWIVDLAIGRGVDSLFRYFTHR